jgi:hypothetical protein
MKPIDFSRATFADLQERLHGQRAAVLAAWIKFGPGTTAAVAERARISILTFRPRTTELYQLGFVRIAEEQRFRGQALYRARTDAELATWVAEQREAARERQTELALGARCA